MQIHENVDTYHPLRSSCYLRLYRSCLFCNNYGFVVQFDFVVSPTFVEPTSKRIF